jgi:hypothetical protein
VVVIVVVLRKGNASREQDSNKRGENNCFANVVH